MSAGCYKPCQRPISKIMRLIFQIIIDPSSFKECEQLGFLCCSSGITELFKLYIARGTLIWKSTFYSSRTAALPYCRNCARIFEIIKANFCSVSMVFFCFFLLSHIDGWCPIQFVVNRPCMSSENIFVGSIKRSMYSIWDFCFWVTSDSFK